MASKNLSPENVLRRLGWPLRLTHLGMIAERVTRAFWPFWSVLILVLAALMLGLQDYAAVESVWISTVLAGLAALATLVYGVRTLDWPTRAEALDRLDQSMPGRPITALIDDQVIGSHDVASTAVWKAHQARMADRASGARAVRPDLRTAPRDPFATRYVALLALSVALLFGSVWRVGSVTTLAPGQGEALASGPVWEGWIEPPTYTGLPAAYLADQSGDTLEIPEGSMLTLRLYGEVGALTVSETVSGRMGEVPAATDPVQQFAATQDGTVSIDGPGGRSWDVVLMRDGAPEITVEGDAETTARGEMTLPFSARDDYGVARGEARLVLDLDAVSRIHGLATDPEPRDAIIVELPMPITGDRAEFTETFIEDFSQHPWAHLPVRVELIAEDDSGLTGTTGALPMALPARRFFDPMAGAIIEQRRDLLWSRDNATRVSQILRAVSHRAEDVFRSETAYLRLRVVLRRLETMTRYGLEPEQRDEIAAALWDLAIVLEEGDIGDALERMRRAQERLSEAMRNGASDEEIAELMQELREATQDYIRQLSRQAELDSEQNQNGDQQMSENSMQMSQDDLQRMMDRIQELMEEGRMAEAQEALRELQELMENMRVTQGGQQGQQSAGQQAMEGLAETLREQQGLSDQAFRELQEQFNPGAQAGENEGNEGRNGGQGRGQSHEGTGEGRGEGEGQEGAQPGEGSQQQPGGQQGDGQSMEDSLAQRQEALRQELERQRNGLPGQGTSEGDAAREALRRADRAMDGAGEALEQNDLAEAIDRQAEAMDALREGMRNLGEAMAQEQRNQGQQGMSEGNQNAQQRDPLGRDAGTNGAMGTERGMLPGEDQYGRARDLLDEIRRRSFEQERPRLELDYLKRLLERF